MKKKLFKRFTNQKGITLIELLAVLMILGIIAAVAVPAVIHQVDNSKIKVDGANGAMIRDAVERAYIDGQIVDGDFPITLTPAMGTTTTETITGADTSRSDLSTYLTPNYLKEVPQLQETGKTNFQASLDTNTRVITVITQP